ncbi:MAG: HTH domain-containing protein [Clostridia bacterium]|nr:HTH domain-containing protein [Clostridia bacterium]
MFEKNLQLAELIDVYAELLSERQQRVLDLYYNQDLSLGEIAEDVGISRQGVRDSIKKAERELFFFESKLHLVARENAVREAGDKLLALLPGKTEMLAAAEQLIAAANGYSQ